MFAKVMPAPLAFLQTSSIFSSSLMQYDIKRKRENQHYRRKLYYKNYIRMSDISVPSVR